MAGVTWSRHTRPVPWQLSFRVGNPGLQRDITTHNPRGPEWSAAETQQQIRSQNTDRMDLNLSHTKRLKVVVAVFSLLEVLEVVRVLCVTEWLLTTRWDKTVIMELVFLVLLLVTNLLLYLGTIRRSPVELMAWLVSHLVFLSVQIILLVYFIVVVFIIASPPTQNSWLGLPEGMASNTSEFQQELRYNLAVTLTKLVVLIIIVPLTAMALKIVWREKQRMEEELSATQVIIHDDL